jgi:prepilin-type processing-associated H-X9-DG protein
MRPYARLAGLGAAAALSAVALAGMLQALTPAEESSGRLKQLSAAFSLYLSDHDDRFPMHSSVHAEPKYRWMDAMYVYAAWERPGDVAHLFQAPGAEPELLTRLLVLYPERHGDVRVGGYGYNYQYLGNSRDPAPGAPALPFSAVREEIERPERTILIADTAGARDDRGRRVGVYVVDPPVGSDRGSGKGLFYEGSDPMCRARPAPRHDGKAAVLWVDGSVRFLSPAQLDDSNGDGQPDNGHYNGAFEPDRRR